MNKPSSVMRLAGKLAARDLTHAVYSGLLEREPDAGGAEIYAAQLQQGGNLAAVIQCIASSTEFRRRFVSQCAHELVGEAFRALLQRNPTTEELAGHGGSLSASADVGSLLATIGNSEEFWRRQLSRRRMAMTDRLADAMQAEEAGQTDGAVPGDDVSAAGAGSPVPDALDLVAQRLRAVAASDEWFATLLVRRAAPLMDSISAAFLGEVGVLPGTGAASVAGHSAVDAPRSIADIGSMVRGIAESEPHWRRQLGARSRALVQMAYRALLDRAPSVQELEPAAAVMSRSADLGDLLRALGSSDELWHRLLRGRQQELVRLAYVGLLGREPDAEESSRPAAQPIEDVLKGLADSEELWQMQLRRRSPGLVRGVARALLMGRAGDRAGVLANDTDAVTALMVKRIRSITDSEGYFSALFYRRRKALINAVYQALLARPVDPEGMTTYGRTMVGPDGIGRLIGEVAASAEYRQRLKATAALSDDAPTAGGMAFAHVEQLFQKFAGRSATSIEISRCLAGGDQTGRVAPAVLREFALEREPRCRKILLFGAYGNGNMGDTYQAIAMQRHLREAWDLEESQIFATSLLCSAEYPFPASQKLPFEAILDPQLVNQFDCLVIGGGGLIAHPHAPLFDEKWVRQIHTPILLMALGAEPLTAEKHRPLLERAWMVSGRDEVSLAVLREVREDAFLLRDPILCAGSIGELMAFDAPLTSPALVEAQSAPEVLWILRHAVSRRDVAFLTAAAGLITRAPERHVVVALEPDRDKGLEHFLPGQVRYLAGLTSLEPLLERTRLIVSMRYHGCIFAALAGKPSIGYSQRKIIGLYDEMAVPGCYEPDFDRLAEWTGTPGSFEFSPAPLEPLRGAFRSRLKAIRGSAFPGDCAHRGADPAVGHAS